MPRSDADQPRLHSDDDDVVAHSPRAENEEAPKETGDEEEPDVEAHSPRMTPRMQPRGT